MAKIKIRASERGTFTRYAREHGETVQQAAASVLRNKNASPALRKKANFARNFGKKK